MTKELHLKLVAAWWDGTLEINDQDDRWLIPAYSPCSVCSDPKNYRIRPKPTMRPWKPEEVPLPLVFRWKTHTAAPCVSLGITDGRLQYWGRSSAFDVGMAELLEMCDHSTDGGKTWKPCGVEEVA